MSCSVRQARPGKVRASDAGTIAPIPGVDLGVVTTREILKKLAQVDEVYL